MRIVLSCVLAIGVILTVTALPRAGDNPRAELLAMLDKSIKASGGEAKVAKLQAVSWKGTSPIDAGNVQITLNHEGSFRGWEQARMDNDLQANGRSNKILLVMSDGKAWLMGPGGKANDLPPQVASPLRGIFYSVRVAQLLPALKSKEFELSHLGEIKLGERPALGILVSQKGRPDVSLFFDKENALPVKTATRITDQQGIERDLEVLFTDYKDFDGLKHFTTVTFRLENAKDVRTELTEVRPQGELDASLFAPPESVLGEPGA